MSLRSVTENDLIEEGTNMYRNPIPAIGTLRSEELGSNHEDLTHDTNYKYEPLNHNNDSHQIRLIHLLPAPNLEATVQCELFHASLDEKPEYEAVSYVWGDPKITAPIQLLYQKHFVTTNLATALRYFRLKDKPRILWVDALSINQTDVAEKNHQVANMRRIYLQASKVLVWLGEEGSAQRALDFCQFRASKLRSGNSFDSWFMEGIAACTELFYRRAWWKRLWVIQEACHGNKVVAFIGNIQVDLDELCQQLWSEFKISMLSLDYEDDCVRGYLFPIRATSYASQHVDHIKFIRSMKHHTFFTLLRLTRNQEATDSRDMIFGLLGILGGQQLPKIQIEADYNLSIREVYIVATRKTFLEAGSVLLMVESMGRSISNLWVPSWVPDYSKKQRRIPTFFTDFLSLIFREPIGTANFCLDNKLSSSSVEKHSEVLDVVGLYVATITAVIPFEIPAYGEATKDERLLTLFKYDQDPKRRDNAAEYADWPSTTDISPQNTSWGPYETRVGDWIVLVKDCYLPLVLRKKGDFFILVGACLLIDAPLPKDRSLPGPETEGYSDIMRGSLSKEIGKTRHLEVFRLR